MRAAGIGIGLAAALTVTACSNHDAPPPTTTVAPTTTAARQADDGVLRIGVLLPSSGAGIDIGQPTTDGVRLALQEINAAGGLDGVPVEWTVRDEGNDAVVAARSVQELLRAGVDAIVGPASSRVALGVLPDIVDAGVVACSPTATSLALDDFPDDNLFFRTAPSDSLQAIAIARALEQTGRNPLAIAYLDDAYGRPIAAAVESALRARGIEIAASVPYTASDESLAVSARALSAAGPGAVAVIGDADTSLRIAASIGTETSPTVIVADAARRPTSLNVVESMDPALRSRIIGVSPTATAPADLLERLQQIRPTSTGLYAANAYDCVNLVALAALAAHSDQPRAIAAEIPQVSASGSSCAGFADCAELLADDRNIDYDGPTGVSMIGPRGDPTNARFDRFTFDENGRDRTLSQLTVSSG